MSTMPDKLPVPEPSEGQGGVDARRIARGLRIAASDTPFVKTTNGWMIPSDSRRGVEYLVWFDEDGAHCSCDDTFRTCKHIVALQIRLNGNRKTRVVPALAFRPTASTIDHPLPASTSNNRTPVQADPPARPDQLTYWQRYNLAQTNEGWLFPQLLHALCALVPEPAGQATGRPRTSVRDLLFGEVYREYCGLSSRRCHTDIEEVAEDGYISKPYGYNVGTDFLNLPETTDLLRALITESARPLQGIERTFAVDSSGFTTSKYARWHDEKYGSRKSGRTYVKTHIFVGVKSHIITAAAASVEPVGDITMLPTLLKETRIAEFTVEELTADGAYLSEPILEWLHAMGILAWIPFRQNAKFHYDNSLWDKHLATFTLNQDLFAEHYHQRSQVESTFSMVKTKYGSSVRGKNPTSQANNVLCKLLANNLYALIHAIYEIGLQPKFESIGALQGLAA